MDSVLGYGAGVVRLSLGDNSRAGRIGDWRIRPMELLHRSDGDRRIDDLGQERKDVSRGFLLSWPSRVVEDTQSLQGFPIIAT